MMSDHISSSYCWPHAGQPHQRWHISGATTAQIHTLACALMQQSPSVCVVLVPDSAALDRVQCLLKCFLKGSSMNIAVFPDWETLPYDHFSPAAQWVSQRLRVLAELVFAQKQPYILIVKISTLMQRLAPPSFITQESLWVKSGESLDRQRLIHQLIHAGYQRQGLVTRHGEFAFRGSLLDIFPNGSKLPYRLDWDNDQIDTLRIFNPATQRSIRHIQQVNLLPAFEFPFHAESIRTFCQLWRARFPQESLHSSLYKQVKQGLASPGLAYYFPLFFQDTGTLFDYLSPQTEFISLPGIHEAAESFWKTIQQRYEQYRYDQHRPILPPEMLFVPTQKLFACLKAHPGVHIHQDAVQPLPIALLSRHQDGEGASLYPLLTQCWQEGFRVLLVFKHLGRAHYFLEWYRNLKTSSLDCEEKFKLQSFESYDQFIHSKCMLGWIEGYVDEGDRLDHIQIVLLTEKELFTTQLEAPSKDASNDAVQPVPSIFSHLADLSVGHPIVHVKHGIGCYKGLQRLKTGDVDAEYLVLEYANQDKIYLPITELHQIYAYRATGDSSPCWDVLKGKRWRQAKQKAIEKVRDVAAELLDSYAKRRAQEGLCFHIEDTDYDCFIHEFPYVPTPDQQRAIDEVTADMCAQRCMDRLICGDTGFGKTEVAMRAAFLAVQNHTQVAILVPTTLLVDQHQHTFESRFMRWPVKVASLSRFKSAAEQRTVLQGLADGSVDIVIGTHKLIQDRVQFKQLGLLIIDEEHRFGVRHKEKMRRTYSGIDILTLTATPIPRTLNLSLSKVRDLSIIATPPAKRLPVKTSVVPYDEALIREAMMRELMRGGQVYFVHNSVASIAKKAEELQRLAPGVAWGIAHGQMPERELEQVMHRFYDRDIQLLVATTIIESGIDVPHANTIIIERADRLGLAQLHQLRGRVGRSDSQAYAYLLKPPGEKLTREAYERLEAAVAYQGVGAGFMLAQQDLDIRGAGEFLGEEQSGHIQKIGFSLYMDLLERAVTALKHQERLPQEQDLTASTHVEISMYVSALIPEEYVDDICQRLTLYRRLAQTESLQELESLGEEMLDRWGRWPEPVEHLFILNRMRFILQQLPVIKADIGLKEARLQCHAQAHINTECLLALLQRAADRYRLTASSRLLIHWKPEELQLHDKLTVLEKCVQDLKSCFSENR